MLAGKPPDASRHVFRRGKRFPRAIAWLGFRSFWGHLWHLCASVIATEDIDARDWMRPDSPERLTARVARAIGAAGAGDSLTEKLGDDLWIDFIADTGDDRDVSQAVADFVFRAHAVAHEGGEITLPRGRLLLFGGDTAYPVATDLEIHNRVCVPFNEVLRTRQDGRPRALLGIPGNHDWYCALDGFARMFRVRRGKVGVARPDHDVDRAGQIGHFLDWVEAFRVGKHVQKRRALPLYGYRPVQQASYFGLRLAPGLDLWAVDRQLRTVDFAQRAHFLEQRARAPDHGLLLLLADPVYTMLEPHAIGEETLQSLELSLTADSPLILTGDTHHYCRMRFSDAMHVVAGGGGAFLHPARIARAGLPVPEAEFPGPKASLSLAMQVPWQIAGGRSGFVIHTILALLYAPAMLVGSPMRFEIGCALIGALAAIGCFLLAGWRKRRWLAIFALSALCGGWTGGLPLAFSIALARFGAAARAAAAEGPWMSRLGETAPVAIYLLAIFLGALGFGAFLALCTILGLESHHAFAALAHPGYKHFVRLRVRKDGSGVDGWAIGKIDPLDPRSEPVLIDSFCWQNPRFQAPAVAAETVLLPNSRSRGEQ